MEHYTALVYMVCPSILSTWWQDCWAQGGYLAELTSREEELAVSEVISHEDHFWLGLNDVAQEGGAHGSGDSFKFQTKSLLQAGSCGQRVTRC